MTQLILYAAFFITGVGAGLCVNVFMVRGVPVIHGGGELIVLLAIPAGIAVGYKLGKTKMKRNLENALEAAEDRITELEEKYEQDKHTS